ncbi:Mdm2-binding protein [Lonchura striata]|uniref:Mdm2-binding protein n=1 Tax=Lonchura striata TaxID=40157 RepID=A0A218VEF0_9PASE|nr:Mdm2-binding protein [Lonchura striata domestica]
MMLPCSVAGIPGAKKWYFASHVICGYYQFCSSDWEEISVDTQKSEDSFQASIDETLGTTQNFEEDDSNSQESLSLTEPTSVVVKEMISHSLGRAMVDVILQAVECDGPKLKDCLPAIGALKHLREWHSAQITIAASDAKGSWQKIADYLSADFVSSDDIMNVIDLNELWRGKIQIWERKVGALFTLPCNVSSVVIPSPAQLSTKKWKEYMAKKPKVISVPEIELKGESCRYYFLLQGNGSGGCKATLIHSAGQINGMATLAAVNGKLKAKTEEAESGKSNDLFINEYLNAGK